MSTSMLRSKKTIEERVRKTGLTRAGQIMRTYKAIGKRNPKDHPSMKEVEDIVIALCGCAFEDGFRFALSVLEKGMADDSFTKEARRNPLLGVDLYEEGRNADIPNLQEDGPDCDAVQ